MPTVSSLLYYSAPLTPGGRDDDWCIDAVSRPPEALFNFRKVPHRTAVTDVRDGTVSPTLDGMGFEMAVAPTRADQRALLEGSAPAVERYQRETEELLTGLTGADAVEFFDVTLRREHGDAPADPAHQSPHLRVHVDQSPRSAWARAVDTAGPGRRFSRFQIINVWRPLIEPVRNFPLALCDYRSLDPAADLVVTRLDFPAWLKDRENYSVRHNPGHRWYHWGALSPDEALIFKCYDSASLGLARTGHGPEDDGTAGDGTDAGGRAAAGPRRGGLVDTAGLSPHTAFFDEEGPTTGHLRISLEMRALIFHD
ncbi:CmcJ/NvfI family oxidoreductase [Streptomyces clavuligerus]|uniref:Methyltransferase CmcJ n=1 Tax=Streptomyces clavuligerus TaxID=1901 RepID=B5GLB4_STRCL|nr:CmcJ/NvfI family oxidoreductase [Streptomyces clavuligerus]AAC32492.1 methyltransferase CmcJ [Streptomyces clavuligerus]ANW18125.1 7-alpha-cephem-methoxylase [Streptomyces clavuligerus]AXU12687.1 7-alpha-cephem-methoxylase [Streptomyces clavuligerus]EDY47110.1 7-alpha-cephem-methoxylase P8 chain [Streptomyces clavuligerus]EFG09282.1 Hypothetical protein SCLAV_4207 [Streptomyces clavuligerus]